MDWGSIAQIGAAVLPAIFGGGSSGSAPSTGGGTNWGAILAALGSQAAKIKATPLAGADESDIRKANRINLLTGLLGGGVSALGTSMVQQRQAAADAKALKILSGLETTTGQPIVPGGSTGTEPVGATPTVTTGDGQDILGLGSIASQYGELSPTMQKRVMDYAKEQQKQFQKAIAPMSPQEAAAIGSIAAQLSPVEESRPMYAEQLERRFQQQKASQLPFGLRQRAEEITSQRPPVIGSLFGQQPPQTEGITPATTPTVTMERRPTALVEEFPQVSELPAEVQTEFNQAMDVLGGRRQQTTPTLRGEEPPTPTPRAPAPTPSPTPTATPFPAQVEVEQLSAKKAALENDVVALQRVIQDPRVPEQQRQRAPAALAVAREELKMITENLDRSSRAFEKQQSGAREEERIGLTRAQQERQEKRGQRDFNFEIDKQAGAIQDKNGQPLIDQVRMLQNTLNFSELDRFGQNNALINLRRAQDNTGVLLGEMQQTLSTLQSSLKQNVDTVLSKMGRKTAPLTIEEFAPVYKTIALTAASTHSAIKNAQTEGLRFYNEYGGEYTGKPKLKFQEDLADLENIYENALEQLPPELRRGLPVTIKGINTNNKEDFQRAFAGLSPRQTSMPTAASSPIAGLVPSATPTAAPRRFQAGDQVGQFVIEGQVTR